MNKQGREGSPLPNSITRKETAPQNKQERKLHAVDNLEKYRLALPAMKEYISRVSGKITQIDTKLNQSNFFDTLYDDKKKEGIISYIENIENLILKVEKDKLNESEKKKVLRNIDINYKKFNLVSEKFEEYVDIIVKETKRRKDKIESREKAQKIREDILSKGDEVWHPRTKEEMDYAKENPKQAEATEDVFYGGEKPWTPGVVEEMEDYGVSIPKKSETNVVRDYKKYGELKTPDYHPTKQYEMDEYSVAQQKPSELGEKVADYGQGTKDNSFIYDLKKGNILPENVTPQVMKLFEEHLNELTKNLQEAQKKFDTEKKGWWKSVKRVFTGAGSEAEWQLKTAQRELSDFGEALTKVKTTNRTETAYGKRNMAKFETRSRGEEMAQNAGVYRTK